MASLCAHVEQLLQPRSLTGMQASRRCASEIFPSKFLGSALFPQGQNVLDGERVQMKPQRLVAVASMGGRGNIIGTGSSIQTPPSGELYLPFKKPTENPKMARGSADDHLEILRDRRGVWPEYAPLLQGLYQQGYSSQTIEEVTGLTAVEQNSLVVGAQVYNTLRSGGMGAEALAYFESSDANLLYELRILAVGQRQEAALYAMSSRLDGKAVKELVRSIKEYDRSRGREGRDAFSSAPGDCLAYAQYRNALECKRPDEKESIIEKGLLMAVTDKAREKLSELLQGEETSVEKDVALLQVIRLTDDEAFHRVVAVAGNVATATVEAVMAAPLSQASSAFGVFTSQGECSWVALPPYSPVLQAQSPVALLVDDASDLPGKRIPKSTKPQPALLLVDREGLEPIADESFYVAASVKGPGLQVMSGMQIRAGGEKVVARVLLGLRPAARSPAIETFPDDLE